MRQTREFDGSQRTYMLVKLSALLGAIGTGLLALDVARPDFLKVLRSSFGSFSNTKIKLSLIYKRQPTEEELQSISTIQTVGLFSVMMLFIVAYYILKPSNDAVNHYMRFVSIYPITYTVLIAIGFLLLKYGNNKGRHLVATATYLVLPSIIVAMAVFVILAWPIQFIVALTVRSEGRLIGENQAPRFLGLIILFASFVLQLL